MTTAMAGPMRVIILDTLLYVNMFPGMLGKLQRIWLETYLRMSDNTPTILCFHHTPRADLLDMRQLFEIVAPVKKVKAIVFGHSHKYQFSEYDGIHLINLPATGYNFTGSQPVGWVEARMTDQAGEFILHAIGGNMRHHGSVRFLQWRASRTAAERSRVCHSSNWHGRCRSHLRRNCGLFQSNIGLGCHGQGPQTRCFAFGNPQTCFDRALSNESAHPKNTAGVGCAVHTISPINNQRKALRPLPRRADGM